MSCDFWPKKRAPIGRSELLGFLFCRFGDRDSLARIANLKARAAPHADVLAQLADLRRNQLRDRDSLVLDERLLQQANFLVELFHLSRHHLLRNVLRLTGSDSLRDIDFLLAIEIRFGHIFLAYKFRIARGDVHGDVVDEFFEVLGTRYKIALAIYFEQHADLSAGMNIAGYRALTGHARCLLGRHRNALLAQDYDRLLHIAL